MLAVGDCLRGTLSGSGSAIFAGAEGCSGNEVDLNGSSVNVIGGIHSNGQVQVTGGGQGNTVTGTVSHVGGTNIGSNTTLVPADGNPTNVTVQNYPIDLEYDDFVSAANSSVGEDGWAYTIMMADAPGDYHYIPAPGNGSPISKGDLEGLGLIVDNEFLPGVYVAPSGFKFSGAGDYHYIPAPGNGSPISKSDLETLNLIVNGEFLPGVYVAPSGFKFSGANGNGVIGDSVTFVSKGEIDLSGNNTMMRPYFSGLLMLSDGFGDPCDSNAVIKMSGSQVSWGGIIFAPNGNVNMSFSANSTFYGSIIAGTVDVSGSQTTIIYDPAYLPPDPDTIELGT